MAKKTKLYNVKKEKDAEELRYALYEFIIYMFAYAVVIMLVSKLFRGFYVENIGYAFLAACVISLFNSFLKPTLTILTLPITIASFGILYPITNMIILALTDLVLGPHFILGGFFTTFFVSIFIAVLKIIVDRCFIEPLIEGKKIR